MAESNLRRAVRVEAGQHDAALVGDPVAVRVLQVKEVRRHRHEHAAVPRHHAVRVGQARGEIRPRVVAPVAVGVGQERDDALRRGRGLAFERIGITAVLGDIHPATIVEGDGHRDSGRAVPRRQGRCGSRARRRSSQAPRQVTARGDPDWPAPPAGEAATDCIDDAPPIVVRVPATTPHQTTNLPSFMGGHVSAAKQEECRDSRLAASGSRRFDQGRNLLQV